MMDSRVLDNGYMLPCQTVFPNLVAAERRSCCGGATGAPPLAARMIAELSKNT